MRLIIYCIHLVILVGHKCTFIFKVIVHKQDLTTVILEWFSDYLVFFLSLPSFLCYLHFVGIFFALVPFNFYVPCLLHKRILVCGYLFLF